MKPFSIAKARSAKDAVQLYQDAQPDQVSFSAGGTTLVDMLKLDLQRPDLLIDILPARSKLKYIKSTSKGLTVGALATMSELANNEEVKQSFPAVVDSLRLAASPQIRNAATIGGNLLQQTRCAYFRDRFSACNRRKPGSGCAAIGGDTRGLAILGTSDHCIANYPGDLAVALLALGAEIRILTTEGKTRKTKLSSFYRLPKNEPHLTTHLEPGELITSVTIPKGNWQSSVYAKVRDRASYAFALSSAAVALQLDAKGKVKKTSVALGGLASIPWLCPEVQDYLKGHKIEESTARAAAELCFVDAEFDEARSFKVELGIRTLTRALLKANESV